MEPPDVQDEEGAVSLESLPFDILYYILRQLPASSLPAARQACRALRKGATGLIHQLHIDVSMLEAPLRFSQDPDPWLSYVKRIDLYSTGQKLKVSAADLPPSDVFQYSTEANALDALLSAVQQEGHTAAVHAAAKAAKAHAEAASTACARVTQARGTVVWQGAQAQDLMHSCAADASRVAEAASEAMREASVAARHAQAARDETCAIYEQAAIPAIVSAAEASAASATAAAHTAMLFDQSRAAVAGCATGATNAASQARFALNIATVASRALSTPTMPAHHTWHAADAIRLTFTAAKRAAEAAGGYAAAAACTGLEADEAPASSTPPGPPHTEHTGSVASALTASAARAAAEAEALCSAATQALNAMGVGPGGPKSQTSHTSAAHAPLSCSCGDACMHGGTCVHVGACVHSQQHSQQECGGPCGVQCVCSDSSGSVMQGGGAVTGMRQRGRWPSVQELSLVVLPTAAKPLTLLQPAVFPNLRRLELRRYSADPVQKPPFWDALASLTQLRELLISGWDLEPEDQAGLPRLTCLTQLTVAELQNNGEGLRCLSSLTNLQELVLDTLRYDATIPSEFCGLSQLSSLSCLRFRTVGPLFDEVTSLVGLPIRAFEITSHFEPSLPLAIERLLHSNTCLEELALSHFELSEPLAAALKRHPHFKKLRIGRIRDVDTPLSTLEELSLHFLEIPTGAPQPLGILTPRLRFLNVSEFNSMPLQVDVLLPSTLTAELLPADAPPLTSLTRLKTVSCLVNHGLLAAAPNVTHLEVVVAWADADGLAATATMRIVCDICRHALELLSVQAALSEWEHGKEPAAAHTIPPSDSQPQQGLPEITRARIGTITTGLILIAALMSGPHQLQHALRRKVPEYLEGPEDPRQPPPTLLAALQHCLHQLQYLVAAAQEWHCSATSQQTGDGATAAPAADHLETLSLLAEDTLSLLTPLLHACWAAACAAHQQQQEQQAQQAMHAAQHPLAHHMAQQAVALEQHAAGLSNQLQQATQQLHQLHALQQELQAQLQGAHEDGAQPEQVAGLQQELVGQQLLLMGVQAEQQELLQDIQHTAQHNLLVQLHIAEQQQQEQQQEQEQGVNEEQGWEEEGAPLQPYTGLLEASQGQPEEQNHQGHQQQQQQQQDVNQEMQLGAVDVNEVLHAMGEDEGLLHGVGGGVPQAGGSWLQVQSSQDKLLQQCAALLQLFQRQLRSLGQAGGLHQARVQQQQQAGHANQEQAQQQQGCAGGVQMGHAGQEQQQDCTGGVPQECAGGVQRQGRPLLDVHAAEQMLQARLRAAQEQWEALSSDSWAVQASKWPLQHITLFSNEQTQLDDLQALTLLLPNVRASLRGLDADAPQ